jgi:hypothetical protein
MFNLFLNMLYFDVRDSDCTEHYKYYILLCDAIEYCTRVSILEGRVSILEGLTASIFRV